MSRIYHISVNGCDYCTGGERDPFRTISHAAAIAQPGDTVRVHEGEYREWVDPQNAGTCEERIIYEAAPGEHVVIKGSELLKGWEVYDGTVWVNRIPNSLFGEWNPFAVPVDGDWLIQPKEQPVHVADVYLNGVGLYEAFSVAEVKEARKRTCGYQVYCADHDEPIADPENTIYQWYAEVAEEYTTLWVNFHSFDPNVEMVEISVRKCCFYPKKAGIGFITLRGFEICHAAGAWAPPTVEQFGMVGVHWSKGWIIENNHIHHTKCSAVSMGHDLSSRSGCKPGYQYQMEAVFRGLKDGWNKEKIGSHIVRNNVIHDCGQNGVVGHMGCVFSRIEHNHIYNIGVRHEYFGFEIAGIKLHAAIDVMIENNNVHHCTLGAWLDWQAQGARVSRNLFHQNDRDMMVEVTHGPCLVDNNVFASHYSFDNSAQGTAWVHNLIVGCMHREAVLTRSTPYHDPHSTAVAGCAIVFSGDDRLMNNIFTGERAVRRKDQHLGGACYDGHTLAEEYQERLRAEKNDDDGKYYRVPQPVWIEDNVYAGYARPFDKGQGALWVEQIPVSVACENGVYYVEINLPQDAADYSVQPVTTQRLGAPRITEEMYENPDGSSVDFAPDLCGERRGECFPAGPFARLKAGQNRIQVWKQ